MPYDPNAIKVSEKFAKIPEPWSPKVIAQMNDLHVKAAKFEGEFIWHKHDDTDELFFVHKGEMTIKYRDREVPVRAGEMHIVPKGVEHKPVAAAECEVLMIEPAGTLNTGDAGGERTVAEVPWI